MSADRTVNYALAGVWSAVFVALYLTADVIGRAF